MKPQCALLLVLLVILALHTRGNEALSFAWACVALNGVCRQGACLPSELYFGPLGCGKNFLCCVKFPLTAEN
ncbi:beta-defensin-like 1 [Neoarius graeffei]|uniref:beta-defensin-like 1 n=1 Tax=Neoarius graeffei TaxID=443677 RepID=UPI00298C7DB1|nr:beta-defensin-like 1 [Neoarius graeffei]